MSTGATQELWASRGMWVYAFEAYDTLVPIATSPTGACFVVRHIVPAPLPGTPTKRGPKK